MYQRWCHTCMHIRRYSGHLICGFAGQTSMFCYLIIFIINIISTMIRIFIRLSFCTCSTTRTLVMAIDHTTYIWILPSLHIFKYIITCGATTRCESCHDPLLCCAVSLGLNYTREDHESIRQNRRWMKIVESQLLCLRSWQFFGSPVHQERLQLHILEKNLLFHPSFEHLSWSAVQH